MILAYDGRIIVLKVRIGEFCLENLHLRRGICSNVVSFTKTLKKMSGFRLGFGVRVNKRNAPLWCFAMLFAGMFYLMWYMIIGAGWRLYFFLWAFYKIYYYLFKGIAVGCKKLYQLIKGKTAAPSEASVEPPNE